MYQISEPQTMLEALSASQSSVLDLVNSILRGPSAAREALLNDAAEPCATLKKSAPDAVFDWAFEEVRSRVCAEVVLMLEARYGLHFNMANATADYLEGSFMKKAGEKMREHLLCLWKMITSLLDANPERRRVTTNESLKDESNTLNTLASTEEQDLGEIGGDGMDLDEDSDTEMNIDFPGHADETSSSQDDQKGRKIKGTNRAAKRNAALLVIKAVICISIFL